MIREIFCRTPYNYDVDLVSQNTGVDCSEGEECKTQQHLKDDADINVILKRFGVTGELPNNVKMPQYGDFTGITDFQSALHAVQEADDSFMSMPPDFRAKFDNNPHLFVEWCLDPSNIEEATRMGLAVIVKSAPVPVVSDPAGSKEPVK